LLALGMPTIVPLFFGEAWRSNIPSIIVMVLCCPWGNLGVLYSAIFYARNLGRYVLYIQGVIALLRIIAVLTLWPYGVLPVIAALAASNVAAYLICVFLLSPYVGNRRTELLGVVAGPVVATALMAAATSWLLPADATLVQLILASAAGLAVYAGALLLVDRQRAGNDLRALAALLQRRTALA
jgi:O-antigen/teichoic acid export membrane protein